MKWFRSNIRHGSRLALFALVVQLALSFGHFHGSAAQAAAAAGTDGRTDAAAVLIAAASAAELGAVATIPLVATKGRASYLGERSAGHQDPGATSTAIVLRAAADAASGVSTTPGS